MSKQACMSTYRPMCTFLSPALAKARARALATQVYARCLPANVVDSSASASRKHACARMYTHLHKHTCLCIYHDITLPFPSRLSSHVYHTFSPRAFHPARFQGSPKQETTKRKLIKHGILLRKMQNKHTYTPMLPPPTPPHPLPRLHPKPPT